MKYTTHCLVQIVLNHDKINIWFSKDYNNKLCTTMHQCLVVFPISLGAGAVFRCVSG